jgi:hypothetical protein
MESPVHHGHPRPAPLAGLTAALLGSLLGACAANLRTPEAVDLAERPAQFSQGRVTVVLVDEYGIALPGLRVDLSWEQPSFYKTSAFSNRQGEVSFSGVPEVAEVSVDHPGGRFTGTVVVPRSGRPEYRVMLDTQGGGERMRQQERARLAPPGALPRAGQE